MARFVFRFEPVLRQRAALERIEQLAVARLEGTRVTLEQHLRELSAAIALEREDCRRQLGLDGGKVDVRAVRQQAGSTLRLSMQANQVVLRLAGVHKQLEDARRRLLEATTRRKAVETLRARAQEEWSRAQRRAETIELDELSVIAQARKAGTRSASERAMSMEHTP